MLKCFVGNTDGWRLGSPGYPTDFWLGVVSNGLREGSKRHIVGSLCLADPTFRGVVKATRLTHHCHLAVKSKVEERPSVKRALS